jgi:hypothetical protein
MLKMRKLYQKMHKKWVTDFAVTLKKLNDLHLSYNCYINSIHSFFTIL